jgi:Protein of unknown function (DUF1353)
MDYRVTMAAVLALAFGACAPKMAPINFANPGRFEGDVVAKWQPDGRDMQLVQPFAFVDGEARRWNAPAQHTINGASIPRALWSIVGGPYEGQYRLASVVHDVACDVKEARFQDVHRMFFAAAVAAGTGRTRAKVMYAAIFHFGPRWGTPVPRTVAQEGQELRDDAMRMRQYIEDSPEISLDRIDQFTSAELAQVHPVIRDEMRYPPEHTQAGPRTGR